MKILLCGGSGFIGINFALYTKKHFPQHKIIVIDNLEYSACPQTLHKNKIPLIVKDIRNIKEIEPLFDDIDLVINFAAQTHNDNSFTTPINFINTNIIGTYNLITLCTKYNIRYHHISTDEVFGPIKENQFIEHDINTPYNPTSPYSASKASADMLVNAWIHSYNLQATITYSCNNYGPYQHIEKFIPRSITSRILDNSPHIYGSGKQIREWIHVEDHCKILWAIINSKKTGKYIISSGIEKTNIQVIQTINKFFNKPKNDYKHVSDRKYHDFKYKTNSTYTQQIFNTKLSHTNFEKEIKQLCQWYIDNPWFWKENKEKVEKQYEIDDK